MNIKLQLLSTEIVMVRVRSYLDHGQGYGNKAVRNMGNSQDKHQTMKLFETFMWNEGFMTLDDI
jgi:hypothetical protein